MIKKDITAPFTGIKIELVYLPIESLTPYEKNARKHQKADIDVIKKSIEEFGFNDPIGIWSHKNIIIEGHGRLLALKELGWKTVPCIRLDHLTDEQRKAYALAHNRSAELSTWDFDTLDEELAGLKDEFDLEKLGFGALLPQEEFENNEEEFDIDNFVSDEPISKRGDIYQLGRHTIMCGDALNPNDVKTLIGDKEIELLFTDPPYELETQGGGILKHSNQMEQIEENGVGSFDPSKLTLWCKTNIFFHNKPLIKCYIELAERNKVPYDLAIYHKQNTVPNYKGHLMTDIEYIAIIGEQDPQKGFNKEDYSKVWQGGKDIDNELSYSKPVDLCLKFIKLYSTERVLDLFGGSGSTLIACEESKRTCYMMELNPVFVDVIVKRYLKYVGSTQNCYLNGQPLPEEFTIGILD